MAGAAYGNVPEELTVVESGIRYVAPLASGQKTGWFYDQAANRRKLAAFLPRMPMFWMPAATSEHGP